MATHYRTQGLILKKRDSGESDRIFTVFTRDYGRLELLAKAERKIKSKLRGGLEIFYLSEVEFIQGKTHKTLTDATLINSFDNLRKDLGLLRTAQRIATAADRMIKGQEADENIWQLFSEVFDKLNDYIPKAKPYALIYYYFLWNLLSFLGYQPELYSCSLCQKKITPEKIYFSAKEGGLICENCQEPVKEKKALGADTVKVIRLFLRKDWPTLKRLKLEEDNLKDLSFISRYFSRAVLRQME